MAVPPTPPPPIWTEKGAGNEPGFTGNDDPTAGYGARLVFIPPAPPPPAPAYPGDAITAPPPPPPATTRYSTVSPKPPIALTSKVPDDVKMCDL